MSRSASLAYSALEQANIRLEDAIIAELEEGPGNISQIILNLQESKKFLRQLQADVDALRAKMQDLSYVDLPTLEITDLDKVGNELATSGCANREAWKYIAKMMKSEGFYGILNDFEKHVTKLRVLTKMLQNKLDALKASAEIGILHITLEENRSGNFKKEFAQLYTKWEEFNQIFLASSLLSTEPWYRYNGTGTMLETQIAESATA